MLSQLRDDLLRAEVGAHLTNAEALVQTALAAAARHATDAEDQTVFLDGLNMQGFRSRI